jgi:hypothetical protein
MKKSPAKKGVSTGTVVAIGASVAAAAAISYYFFGPEGKKNRTKLKGWMVKMKGEIIEKMEDAQEMTESAYATIVDNVAAAYQKTGKIGASEVVAFATILKKNWKGIVGGAKKGAKKSSVAKKAPVATKVAGSKKVAPKKK